jgi:undecaprenyl-diphosphatase
MPDDRSPSTARAHGAGAEIVVNANAGSGRGPDPVEELRAALPAARVVALGEDDDVDAALDHAAQAEVLGVCGGDGTVNAAARVALARNRPLLVVPGGTLNHFARAVGVDEIADAVAAVEHGNEIEVDVGMIDGHEFLNTASFGAYSELVDERERLEGRIGKWTALVVALARVLRRVQPCELEIDGTRRRIWLVFIGNCRYEPSGAVPRERPALADGQFDIRIVDASTRWSRTRFVFAAMCGRADRSRVYEQRVAETLSVHSLDGPLRLACDGETLDGSTTVRIEKARSRLRVLVPPD